jgi:hypothetical protein
MNSLLLFASVKTMVVGVSAQINSDLRDAKHAPIMKERVDVQAPLHNSGTSALSHNITNSKDLTITDIGKAGNVYYAYENGLFKGQESTNYDLSTGLIQHIHRADPTTYTDANRNNSSIVSTPSAVGGLIWTYKMLLPFDGSHYTRYPQGFIYNIEHSPAPTSVIAGANGPAHDGATRDIRFFVSTTNDEVMTGMLSKFFGLDYMYDNFEYGVWLTDDECVPGRGDTVEGDEYTNFV